MRIVPALLLAAVLVACSGVKLPPVSPDQVEVYSEPNGQFPPEEYERMAFMERAFTSDECARETGTTTCDDEETWQFGLEWLKSWAGQQGADAILIQEMGYSTAGQRYVATAIYFPSRHPELQQ